MIGAAMENIHKANRRNCNRLVHACHIFEYHNRIGTENGHLLQIRFCPS